MLEARNQPAEQPSGVAKWAARPPHISIDSNGNLTQKVEGSTTWTYEWNTENQLTRVLSNGSEVTRYKYDPIGRRVERVAGGTTTTWAYAGKDILRETSGATSWKYVHGPGIDEPLAKEDGAGTLTHFHVDALGSVVRVTNGAGTPITAYGYDAFGALTGGSDGYAYTGREWDAGSQLYYYRARYYDPKLGRFLSEDPIGLDGGINFYAYVENNPVLFVDPNGLKGVPRPQTRRPPMRLRPPTPRLGPPSGGRGTPSPPPMRFPLGGPGATIGPPGGGQPPSGPGDTCPVPPSNPRCERLYKNWVENCHFMEPPGDALDLCLFKADVNYRLCLADLDHLRIE